MQRAIAERARAGQAETELRFTVQRAVAGQAVGDTDVNPLIKAYADDKVIACLELDPNIIKSDLTGCWLRSLLCVPIIPHQLACCMPCSLFGSTIPKVNEAVAAHRLVLRENTLLYEVDPYPQILQNSNYQQMIFRPACFACCNDYERGKTMRIREVIPLVDVASAKVEECAEHHCGLPMAPDTFVVRAKSAHPMMPVVAIDAPASASAQAFAQKIMEQAQRAQVPDATVMKLYRERIAPFNAMLGMMMGMGGMMPGGMGNLNGVQVSPYQQQHLISMMQMQHQSGGAPPAVAIADVDAPAVVPIAAAVPAAIPPKCESVKLTVNV